MKKGKYILFATLVAMVVLFAVYCIAKPYDIENKSFNESNKSFEDNIYFTKWLSYYGYSINEKKGQIEIPYIDYNKSHEFEDNIKYVELLPNCELLSVNSFKILNGGSKEQLDINTLSVAYDLKKIGKADINKISIHLKNNKVITWDVGNIIIDILKINNYNHLELGVRQFVASDFDEYSFTLINNSLEDILVKNLVFDFPNNVTIKNLKISDTFDNSSALALQEYSLKKNDKKVFNYSIDSKIDKGQYYFYLLKPFLKYIYKNNEYLMPLDFIVYSGQFTDDLINEVKKNKHL